MTSQEIKAMQFENLQLKQANSNLIKEQQEFQNSLKAEIARIKTLGPWKRFWGSVQLFLDLFTTIEAGFKDYTK